VDKEPIENALALLPQQSAPPDFTRRVLERLERSESRRRLRRRVAAAGLALTLLAGASLRLRQEEIERARLAAMRSEQKQIAVELEKLKRATRAPDPVVYLGGDDRVDYVLDLRQFQSRRSATRRRATPAREDPL
jgi:hypothetical protein